MNYKVKIKTCYTKIRLQHSQCRLTPVSLLIIQFAHSHTFGTRTDTCKYMFDKCATGCATGQEIVAPPSSSRDKVNRKRWTILGFSLLCYFLFCRYRRQLDTTQHARGRSCDRPTRHSISWLLSVLQQILRQSPNSTMHLRTYHAIWMQKTVKLSLCLTKHHAMKTYWGVEV
jgi:hypothetical protein